jgi:hypothetical protein
MKLLRPITRLGGVAVLSAGLLSGCVGNGDGTPTVTPDIAEGTVGLRAFDGCDPLLEYFKESARAQFEAHGHWNFGGLGGVTRDVALGAPENEANAAGNGAPNGAEPDGIAPSVSGTNVQERGVDEADILKSDGRFVYSVKGSTFFIHDAADLTELSQTDIGHDDATLLFNGDRVAVLGQTWGSRAGIFGAEALDGADKGPKTVVTVLDVSDRQAPVQVRRSIIDGTLLAARLVGDVVRLAVHFQGGPNIAQNSEPLDAPIIEGTSSSAGSSSGSAGSSGGAGAEPDADGGDGAEPMQTPAEDQPIPEPADDDERENEAEDEGE